MKAAFLPDRGVVKVSGEDARNFLNGLVTTDVTQLRPDLGRFGALLTPQGKITIDFLITQAPAGHGGGFLFDARRALAQGLADKLDFDKGCYVGQEVVSRMQHRGTARTRTVKVILDGLSPEPGATILAGDKQVGTMGSTSGQHGLALIRTDRVADALDAGLPLTSGG